MMQQKHSQLEEHVGGVSLRKVHNQIHVILHHFNIIKNTLSDWK